MREMQVASGLEFGQIRNIMHSSGKKRQHAQQPGMLGKAYDGVVR